MSDHQEDEGFVHHPDMKDGDNGLYCFLDANRPCGVECMAYGDYEPRSPGLGPQQSNCILLVSAERLGRYVGGMVNLMKKQHEESRTPSVPSPFGRGK